MVRKKPDTSPIKRVKTGEGLLLSVIILFPFAVFGVCWLLFAIVIDYLPYGWSAIVTIFTCVMGFGLIGREIEDVLMARIAHPRPLVNFLTSISMSVTSIFIFLTVGAWVSFTLYELDLVNLLNDSVDPSYSILVETYAWHLVDLIPFTNVEKTFGMKVPMVQFEGWIAGAPILLFRFLVIIVVFNIFRESYKKLREKSKDELIKQINERIDQGKNNENITK